MLLRRAAALTLLAAALCPAQPKLHIEGGNRVDFGELRTTAPVVRELTLSNRGDDTLRISDVSGSCGCTGTLLSRSVIPPGGSGTLKVTFDPAKFRGAVEKVVSMRTNDPSNAKALVTVGATITHILDFSPTSLVFSTRPDSQVSSTVHVRNVSEIPLRITGIRSSAAGLTVEPDRAALDPGESVELLCRIRQAAPGILRGELTITTDHPLLPSVDLRVFSYARPDRSTGSR